MIARQNRTLQYEQLEHRTLLSGIPQEVVVMSENLYMGADPIPIIAASYLSAITGAGPALTEQAVTDFWNDVKATDFSKRAEVIAQQIADNKPDLIGLQEVMTYYTGIPDSLTQNPTPATNVKLDFLQVLQGKLAAKGLQYKAYEQQLGDFEAPGYIDGMLQDLRLVDSVVILARSDLSATQVSYVNPQGGTFQNSVTFSPTVIGPITVHRGWNAVDVNWGQSEFRFVNMCLETPVFPVQQALQGLEVLVGPAWTSKPVILVGDSNSDGSAPGGPNSLTYSMLTADFTNFWIFGRNLYDAWNETHTSDPGYTWGNDPDLKNSQPMTYAPFGMGPYRMDLILHRDAFQATSMSRLGVDAQTRNALGMWPSDHAGVVATLAIKQAANAAPELEPFEYLVDSSTAWNVLGEQLLVPFAVELGEHRELERIDADASGDLTNLVACVIRTPSLEPFDLTACERPDAAATTEQLAALFPDWLIEATAQAPQRVLGLPSDREAIRLLALDALLTRYGTQTDSELLEYIEGVDLELLATER